MTDGTAVPFRVGSVLSRGFRLLFRNIVPFGLVALLMTAPYVVLLFLESVGDAEALVLAVAFLVFKVLLANIATAAIAYGTYQDMRGRRVGAGSVLVKGMTTILPVLGVAFLSFLAMMLGLMVLVVPGLIVMTMLWVAVPVVVVERPGVIPSLGRSAALTAGNRWRVFGIILILLVIGEVADVIVKTAFVMTQTTTGSVVVFVLATGLVTAFMTAVGAVVAAVGYHDLRVAREGVAIEDIAMVFD